MSELLERLNEQLSELKANGLYKAERIIETPQDCTIQTASHQSLINFCANNYLNLANDPLIIESAINALKTYGYGMSSVRFICGTQSTHKLLESRLSHFLKTEDCILHSSCFDANLGLFEALLTEEDAIISDRLNHASIIDGIRLSQAKRFVYQHNDMFDLEEKLKASQQARTRLIVTDGVFSMEGTFASLPEIIALAKRYKALVMVDDSHAVGVVGKTGRGTPEYFNCLGEIDILSGTLGKTLGGATGGYLAGRQPIIEWLRQRSRPYLFSNTLAPTIAKTSLAALDLIEQHPERIEQLHNRTTYFRQHIQALGYTILGSTHPIVPIIIGDAQLASTLADRLLEKGIYVISFSYPVVPKNEARIRVQINAHHTEEQLNQAISAFKAVGQQLKVIP